MVYSLSLKVSLILFSFNAPGTVPRSRPPASRAGMLEISEGIPRSRPRQEEMFFLEKNLAGRTPDSVIFARGILIAQPLHPMAEDSFTDRLQRSQLLHDIIAGLVPVYTPGIPLPGELDLRLPAFASTIQTASLANDAAQDAAQDYGNMALQRETLLATVLKAATSVLAWLRSKKSSLGSLLTRAEKVVDRMRGPKEKQPAPPPPANPGDPVPKPRNRGEQSYAEQAGHLRTLIRLLSANPAYNPVAAPGEPPHPASLGNLNGLLSSLRSYNTVLCNKDADLINAEGDRQDAFEDEKTGLHVHFLAVKSAVQAQYGYNSPQHGQVSGIEW